MYNREVNLTGPPYIFRFRTNNDYTIDEIAKNYIFFADAESLNDPFDANPDLLRFTDNKEEINRLYTIISDIAGDKIMQNFQRNINSDELYNFFKKAMYNYIDLYGIASFTMYFQNMPLWANYTNDFKGVCLQFNSNFDKSFFRGLRPVIYENELTQREYLPTIDEEEIINFFFRKQESWNYEKELRLIKEKKGKIKFDRKALVNVILGYNSDEDFKQKIFKSIYDNYSDVKLYILEKPTKINKITLKEITYI